MGGDYRTHQVLSVVSRTIHETQLLVMQIFAIFRLHHAHVRKDTRLSMLFCTTSDGKLGGASASSPVPFEKRLGMRLDLITWAAVLV